MSEYKNQKQNKPTIDELIEINLNGDVKNDAQYFVKFLRDNKISPHWGAKNSFNVSYKNRRVCIIKVNSDKFELRVNTQYNQDFNECFQNQGEEIKRFLLDNLTYCFECGSCKPGIDIEILGKRLKNACYNPVIRMENPNELLLDCASKLVLLRKNAIKEGKAPKVTYIAMSKRV